MTYMRKEVIGNASLFLGDCVGVLLDIGKVGAVITDPPYGISYRSGPNSRNSISTTGKRFSKGIAGDDVPFDPSPFVSLARDVFFTGAQYFYDRLPAGGTLHCWDKRGEYKPLDQADADIIWSKRPGAPRTFYCVWRGICRHVEYHDPIVHPTQKPVALMDWLCRMTQGVVFDPYMGSGTTGVACANLGRPFVGVEIEQEYFDIACERIANAQKQGKLFDDKPRAEQVSML